MDLHVTWRCTRFTELSAPRSPRAIKTDDNLTCSQRHHVQKASKGRVYRNRKLFSSIPTSFFQKNFALPPKTEAHLPHRTRATKSRGAPRSSAQPTSSSAARQSSKPKSSSAGISSGRTRPRTRARSRAIPSRLRSAGIVSSVGAVSCDRRGSYTEGAFPVFLLAQYIHIYIYSNISVIASTLLDFILSLVGVLR
jgi:hypothetical protein